MSNNINELIKTYRKSNKLSTKSLSDKLNKSSGLINNLENGKSDVFNINLLSNIIKELDIPINEVLSSLILDLSDNTSSSSLPIDEVVSRKALALIDIELRYILATSKNKELTANLLINYIQNQLSIVKNLRDIS